MKFKEIKECGSNNILKWAMSNGADVRSDQAVQSLTNQELYYNLIVEDVNAFELFRLTQQYREKLRVTNQLPAAIPLRRDTQQMFPDELDDNTKLYELVENGCEKFINLALQMKSDDTVIKPEIAQLFIPMICNKYTIQIPLSFTDFIAVMNEDEFRNIFNENYPATIDEVINDNESCMLRNMLLLYLVQSVDIISYPEHFETLLNITKYAPIKSVKHDKLYKFALSSFSKYNKTSRNQIVCSMFNANKTKLIENMRIMSRLRTPLKVSFVVELPIYYMQIIQNTYSSEELEIIFESSMKDIIDTSLICDDFISIDFPEDAEVPEEITNSITLYKTRINECNKDILDLINLIINTSTELNYTNSFSLLPSMYMTKAIFTINMDYADKYVSHIDPVIGEMFTEMLDVGASILSDVK